MKTDSQKIEKKILSNGLTILVKPNNHVPKVSLQLWYNVGSKDEKSGEKGIAHFIEHMIFKGTKELSESDINLITHKLSGSCNAFTSYDYTGYLFDFPKHHWQEALPIMADCMMNCTFKQELLNSELKAVIQELKMYKDNYSSSLIEDMICSIFAGHPYQHPIIGYKHDLWSLNRENLLSFYKKHYIPNNATLVVVGAVDPQGVFSLAEKHFGGIPSNPNYKKDEYPVIKDFSSHNVTLHRDMQQPVVMLAYSIPGAKNKLDYVIDVISLLLGSGRGARLYKKLVDELELVTDIETFSYDLFDEGLFFIEFTPKDNANIDEIIEIIKEEVFLLAKNGPTQEELLRATKKVATDYLSLLENNQKQAYTIGKFFLANGDENYIFNYLSENNSELTCKIKELLESYFRPSLMHIGKVLPLMEEDKKYWLQLQESSDQEDARILSGICREEIVEKGVKVHDVHVKESAGFNFPKYETITLDNGIEVVFYDNKNLPKIDLVLEFKAKYFYDPENLPGLSNFTSDMLLEGTHKHSATELSNAVESLGMNLDASPGYISMGMLSEDFKKGLEFLTEIVSGSIFPESSVEKVRQQIISDIKNYWDNPSQFAGQVIRQHIYGTHHPYKKGMLGTIESVEKITRSDIVDCYNKFISPCEARLAIVGDLSGYNLKKILQDTIGKWHGPKVSDIIYPELLPISSKDINYYINRDQIVLCFGGLSIKRRDPDYDKLFLFEQIFCGGVLGSMSSRLYQLREQSGLFYNIGGSLTARADDQQGMVFIKTTVSIDRLKEAEELIKEAINSAAQNITNEEFLQARNALINSLVDNFESNRQMTNSFLFLKKYGFDQNFFDNRAQELSKITIKDIQEAARKVLHTDSMIKLRIGRVCDKNS